MKFTLTIAFTHGEPINITGDWIGVKYARFANDKYIRNPTNFVIIHHSSREIINIGNPDTILYYRVTPNEQAQEWLNTYIFTGREDIKANTKSGLTDLCMKHGVDQILYY